MVCTCNVVNPSITVNSIPRHFKINDVSFFFLFLSSILIGRIFSSRGYHRRFAFMDVTISCNVNLRVHVYMYMYMYIIIICDLVNTNTHTNGQEILRIRLQSLNRIFLVRRHSTFFLSTFFLRSRGCRWYNVNSVKDYNPFLRRRFRRLHTRLFRHSIFRRDVHEITYEYNWKNQRQNGTW